jgi:hypothetical protein
MRLYLLDIIPRLQKYSSKLDYLTQLTNHHWVSIDDIAINKSVHIFRANNELIVSVDGKVERGKWEYLGNKSLLIDIGSTSYLFKNGFFDENVLALKVDGSDRYALFVNENHYNGELNSLDKVVDFLSIKYLAGSGVTGFDSLQSPTRIQSFASEKEFETVNPILTILFLIIVIFLIAMAMDKFL